MIIHFFHSFLTDKSEAAPYHIYFQAERSVSILANMTIEDLLLRTLRLGANKYRIGPVVKQRRSGKDD